MIDRNEPSPNAVHSNMLCVDHRSHLFDGEPITNNNEPVPVDGRDELMLLI